MMLTNAETAARLREVADLLEAQGANPFRVRAYRTASEILDALDRPVAEVLERDGADGLIGIPGIGESLARSIEQLVQTGRLALLERLRGDTEPERAFATVPGIGSELAERIHEVLGIETLAELEAAAVDGRLAEVPGFGSKRVLAVRESLAGRFRRLPPAAPRRPSTGTAGAASAVPPVAELLDVDAEYRHAAAARRLPRIAPRRFNPSAEAWLPILHTLRGDRHYTALFSNTARAHELGAIRDWVVIYRDDRGGHGRWTVLTARYGKLRGKRVVRGREHECEALYPGRSG